MTTRFGNRTALVPILASLLTAPAAAQAVRWTVDPARSLAWWQIDPHYEHLWATTCPDDPSWQAGEGRSPGYYVDYSTRPVTVASGRSDTRIPLFPRHRVRPVCRHAIRGEVTASDSRWSGARGTVVVLTDSLVTGLDMRDSYARRFIFETGKYPELRFRLDSLVGIQPGDTLRATAIGTFEAHGVPYPVTVPLTAVPEDGGLRVRGQFSFEAPLLVEHFKMSRWKLGMGIGYKRWKTVHAGVDLVLVPAP
ncbi:MAG TPA: YceI family protein [Gemmatimonadales bacterium]|nr:YceI family protein [Gemmatimonadales bacterium]